MKRIIFSAMFFVFLLAAGTFDVDACQCPIMPDKKRVKKMKKESDAIFVGTVKTVSWSDAQTKRVSGKKIVFTVEKSWKSSNVEEYVLYSPASECSPFFEEGKTYLVYAANDENGLLTTDNCFGTREISAVKDDFKYLGKPVSQK